MFRYLKHRGGFTLIEMMIAMSLTSIIFVAVSGVLANNQKGWNTLYRRVNSDVVVDAQVARRAFDRTVRKSFFHKCIVGTMGDFVEIYYAATPSSITPDRYANFFWDTDNQELKVQYGRLEPGTYVHASDDTPVITVLAHDVIECQFSYSNICMRMSFRLDDGNQIPLDVNCTSTRHNGHNG